jgi:hypothetical protein
MKTSFIRLPLLSLFVLLLPCAAQQVSNDLMVSASDVVDTRTTGSVRGECKVSLLLTGDAASDALGVRKINVTKALDSLDRNLVPRSGYKIQNEPIDLTRQSSVLKATLSVCNPSRNASTIKLIEGEIELFMPTEANGAIVHLPGILSAPGRASDHPALKKYGIEITYLTKEAYEANKKQMEEQQSKAALEAGGVFAENFVGIMRGMFGEMGSGNAKNALIFLIQDPEKRIMEIELRDAEGHALTSRMRMSSGPLRKLSFDVPPPANAQLLVYLSTPESSKSYPFRLEQIALP